eukprot:jgi/Hompol1/3924/HPOL_000721-RA
METPLIVALTLLLAAAVAAAVWFLFSSSWLSSTSIVGAAAARRRRQRATKQDTLMLAGLMGAGKTALFHKLCHGRSVETCTSMQENVGQVVLDKDNAKQTSFKLVDLPGHEKLRFKYQQFLPSAKGILFVLDASQIRRVQMLRSAAEYIYTLLADPLSSSHEIPLTVLCNKSEELLALSPEKIQKMLEQEINELRKTRSAGVVGQADLDGGDAEDDEEAAYLGFEGQPFKFEHIPNPVEFVAISCKADPLDSDDAEDAEEEQDADNNETVGNKRGALRSVLLEIVESWAAK